MLFTIDGYNVTKADPATRDLPLEAQRDELVRRLGARGRELLGAGRIVVVFDGQAGVAGGVAGSGVVEVRFARQGTADDAIVALAASSREKLVLVSDDRGLADRVRAHLGRTVEVRSRSCCFEAAGRGSGRKGPRPAPARDVGLPPGANRITKEMKDLWLTDEE